ncbi:MAG: cysteine--tRNA ligase [Verrucomicrobiia bacterium]
MPQFYNTLSRQIESLPFSHGEEIKLYTCGPTVYDYAHIGNFRAYIFEDLLQRFLEATGYRVKRVMNFTDVDDKTIRNSRKQNIPLSEFTAIYKKAFLEDLKTLRIQMPSYMPSATDYIPQMIQMIQTLEQKGIAYQAEDGSVYYRISKFSDYGKLAHLDLEALRPSGRINSDEYEKENLGDFALWKAVTPEDGEVGWESPWGRGRPGWHIECSAMATALLGETIDIHCGGIDNIFPHHEAEIAQSEACSGHCFVKLWMHCEHLRVNNQKMAKSLGNFYTLRDLLEKGFTGDQVRYALLSVHYRIPLNFTLEGLEAAKQALARIDEWKKRLLSLNFDPSEKAEAAPWQKNFLEALADDLNISKALAVLFDVIRETHRAMDQNSLSQQEANAHWKAWEAINQVLAIKTITGTLTIPEAVQKLLEERKLVRETKDFKKSDLLRDQIKSLGWIVKDTPKGQELRPL